MAKDKRTYADRVKADPEYKAKMKLRMRDRKRRQKRLMIEYKGGKCMRCGYDKCDGALDFHHRDPSQKELTLNGQSRSLEALKPELDKCDLLCANCHREVHWQDT